MCLGVPGRIVRMHESQRELAIVDIAGVQREVNIAFVLDEQQGAESCIGIWVLVHVGFAMSRLDEAEAHKTLALLRELDELGQEEADGAHEIRR